ncbi:Transcriptional regulatory protein WalR [bacterium HR13]|nr:Transcriptional regulatory protein WalR [bacterium HR13]
MSHINVFLLEDDLDLAQIVEYNLRKEGYSVRVFHRGTHLLKATEEETPDLILLDVMVPDYDGFRVASVLRSRVELKDVPIIFITVKDAEEDKLKGFSLGADDYITKPFSVKELLARVRAVLKRAGKLSTGGVFKLGELEVDTQRYEVRRGKEKIELTPTEFKILEALLENYARPVSREYLIEVILKKDVYDRTIDVHIKNLREKLGKEGQAIKTVRGFGYKIEL